jgi:predicted small metal-binding protein
MVEADFYSRKDVGFDCQDVVRADIEEQVLHMAVEHAQTVHGLYDNGEREILWLTYGQRALYSSVFLYFHVMTIYRLNQEQPFVIFKVNVVLSVP